MAAGKQRDKSKLYSLILAANNALDRTLQIGDPMCNVKRR
jgi:hypothetical protein